MAERPAGTTLEGMIWNANHVLDLALHPATKKSTDILKGAKGVIILNTVDVGIVFAGTRGSGVVLAKNADGEWSAPSAVTLTSLKIGWTLGAKDKGLIMVFTDADAVDNFLSGSSVEVGGGFKTANETIAKRQDMGAVNTCMSTKGASSIYVYTYKIPPAVEGCSLDAITIKHQNKANERFYGKSVTPEQIICEGVVTVPDGSGIPDLHKKLAALEANQNVEPTPDMEAKKELLRKQAAVSAETAKADLGDEIEEVTA
jgi:lipid-binding SYLF domain-containing protein